jgi:glucokinase
MNEIVLATDLGGTNLRMAAVDCRGKILRRDKIETPRSKSSDAIYSAISNSAKEFFKVEDEIGTVKAIAVAVPGTVSAAKGVILNAPNLPELNGFRVSSAFESEFGFKCILENDANAAAIGEKWRGASKNFSDSICITLGTGVGGGVILDGKIIRGIDGTAGEIGHICVEPFGALCGCGCLGCLEQYSSATAIVRIAREMSRNFPKSKLNCVSEFSSEEVFQAGKQGDHLALAVFKKQGFYLGIALAGLINVLNPEAIVIGGGAAAGWDLFMPELERTIAAHTYPEPRERVKIVRAVMGDDAGLLGAAHLAFQNV